MEGDGIEMSVRSAPIFLGGAGRSGKTLMRWMLDSHPRIVITRRTEMWPRFFDRFGDLRQRENLDRCLQGMLARTQVASLRPDLGRLRHDFSLGEATYPRLFALINEQYAELVGKPRWGDQTGAIVRFTDQLTAAYPGCRVIHMLRDPRDRWVALLDRAGRRRVGDLRRATSAWSSSVSLAARNERMYPGSYTVIRYERMVTDPEGTMRELCAFLGEAFDPSMVRMESVRRYDRERAVSEDGGPISTAYVGAYRGSIDRTDLDFIQREAGAEMTALGYELEPVGLRPSERIRSSFRRPVSRVKTALVRKPA